MNKALAHTIEKLEHAMAWAAHNLYLATKEGDAKKAGQHMAVLQQTVGQLNSVRKLAAATA